jgi:hypothetical protein
MGGTHAELRPSPPMPQGTPIPFLAIGGVLSPVAPAFRAPSLAKQ